MKKITSIVLSVSMAAGALGMNTAVVHAEESAKKVAYISAANQFDFFVYIGAEIKKVGEENGVQVDMFDAALDVSKEADLMSQAILQKYDAIIVGPVDTQALISQFSIYSLSNLTTSSKSVISLLPLTCHIPVIPGLIASLALCLGSYKFVSEINGGLVPTMDISPPYVNSGTTFFQKYLIKHSIINLPSK